MKKMIDLMSEDLRKKYDGIKGDLVGFGDKFFHDNFKELSVDVLNELVQVEPSPVLKGKNNGWAAGIVYALMQINTINTGNGVTIKNVSEYFSISEGTIFKRSKEIRDLLNMDKDNSKWLLKEEEKSSKKAEEEEEIVESMLEVAVTEVEENDSEETANNGEHASYINRFNNYINQQYKTNVEPVSVVKIGRNDVCPCGSGKKYKKCCGKQA